MRGMLGTIAMAAAVLVPLQAANGLLIVQKTSGTAVTRQRTRYSSNPLE